jgi:hypothetical protein
MERGRCYRERGEWKYKGREKREEERKEEMRKKRNKN